MIKVISFFYEKTEDRKLYKKGTVIRHFSKELEDEHIDIGHAVRIETEKKESKPKRKKKEKE